MTDTWEQRNVPVVEGYNTPDDELTFTVVYDGDDDEVTVTASRPFFGVTAVESLVATVDGDPNTLEEGVDFTTTSALVIVIPDASDLGDSLEQLDFWGEHLAAGALRATWVGPVALDPPITAFITAANAPGGTGVVHITGIGFITNGTDPAESFQVYNTDDDIFGPYLISDPEVSALTDTGVTLTDPLLSGETIYVAEVFWNAGVNSHAPSVTPFLVP